MTLMTDLTRFFLKGFVLLVVFLALDRGMASLLHTGLNHHLGLDREARILCVGNSHTMLGIDRAALEKGTGLPVAKYAVNGANVYDRFTMLRHFFSRHPDSVHLVVYDVDDHLLSDDNQSSNTYKLFYPFLDDPIITSYLELHGGTREFFTRRFLATRRYNAVLLNLAFRGLLQRDDNFQSGTVEAEWFKNKLRHGFRATIKVEPRAVDCLEKTIELVHAHGATLVFCYIPTLDLFNSLYGEDHWGVVRRFANFEQGHQGVLFWDYCPKFSGRHELFASPVHLNTTGRKLFTLELIRDLAHLPLAKSSAPQ